MKQRRQIVVERITPGDPVVLMPVAAGASQSQIRQLRLAATAERDNMLDRKGLGGVIGPALAVLTTALRTLDDRLFQFGGM
jgi:hypothetical protein